MKLLSITSLYKSHVRSSKKIIAFSCIGLIVALTLVSSTLYFLDNSRQEVLDTYLHGRSTGNDIQFNIRTTFHSKYQPDINNISATIKNVTASYDFNFINNSATRITHGIGHMWGNTSNFLSNNKTIYIPLNVFQMTPEIQSELQRIHENQYGTNLTFPSFYKNDSSLLKAYFLFNGINWYQDQQIPITEIEPGKITIYAFTIIDRQRFYWPFNLNLTGYEPLLSTYYSPSQNLNLINPQSENNSQTQFDSQSLYPEIYSLSITAESPHVLVFVNNLDQFIQSIQKIYNARILFYDLGDHSVQNYYIVNLQFDYSKLNFASINDFISKQNLFTGTVISDLSYHGFPYIVVTPLSSNYILYVNNQIELLTNQIKFIDLPSLIIALFLAHFVFNLIYKNIIRNISIYKIRGASGWVIFIFQVLDVLVVLTASIFIAMILGIPLSVFTLKSDNLLSFNHSLPEYFVFNFDTVAKIVIYFAIVLEFLINANRIKNLSKISVAETDRIQESGRISEESWKKHFLDVGLILYGIGTYVIYNYITTNPELSLSISPVRSIINDLMIPSPFLFAIGFILLVSKVIPMLIDRLSSSLWDHTGNLTALSFKNIIRYKNNTLRAILIIASIIAFLTFFYSQPYTMLENYKQQVYYQSGADGVAIFKGNTYKQEIVNNLTTSNVFSPYIDSVSSFVYLVGQSSLNEQLNFLLVNTTTYLNTSYLNYDLGLNNSLSKDMKLITITNFANYSQLTPINILADKNTLEQRALGINSNISVTGSYSQNFVVADSFTKWPFLISQIGGFSSGSSFNAVGDINYFLKDLNGTTRGSIFSGVVESGVFVKFKDLSSTQLINITSKIEQDTPLVFKSLPKVEYENNKQNFAYLAIGQVNLNILVSFAIIIIVIILFIQLQVVERKREIYTERALGMKPSQIAYMFYVENIVILILSILIGTIVGIYFIQLITIFSFNSTLINPVSVVFIPMNTLIVTDIIIFLLSLLFSFIPTLSLLKENISNAFIGEA